MSPPATEQTAPSAALYSAREQASGPLLVRFGAWAFRQRSWLPVPLGLAVLLTRTGEAQGPWPIVVGVGLALVGECLRFWAVRHIGTISRTRTSTRIGPLVTTGPFQVVRNPLYLGNWLMWTGLVVASRLLWMLPFAWAVFALQYGTMVQWEESRLRQGFGAQYERYASRVARWVPLPRSAAAARGGSPHPWGDVAFSERGTLIAMGVVAVLLTLKTLAG